jgi:hypothetical protein
VFLLKTPLPVEDEEEFGLTLVNRWSECMPCLQRLYLFHGFDEDSGICDNFWMGSNELYQRVAVASHTGWAWKRFDIRPKDFGKGQILDPGRPSRWMTVLEDDLDPYNSEEE